MSTSFRYVAIQPDRIGDHRKLKTASYLLDFLTDHQTDASGWVNYGRPFGYAWILANWHGNPDDRPAERTLKRHMAILKAAGKVGIRVLGFGNGMMVRVLGSAKWQKELPLPAEQIPMFVKLPVEIRTRKTCEKAGFSTVSKFHTGPSLALVGCQVWPRKEVKKYNEEKCSSASRAGSVEILEKSSEEIDARRRLLLDQAEIVRQKFKSTG